MLPLTVNWERSPSAPTPVFGVNTKQNYSPQPTDNVYDSGKFDTINPNVFMGKRATDGKLNFQQYGKMFSQSYNAPTNNSAWESNVSWAGNTGMSKSGNYQGMNINFDQELSNADLTNTDLTGADLSYANLSGSILVDANLTGANLLFTNRRFL